MGCLDSPPPQVFRSGRSLKTAAADFSTSVHASFSAHVVKSTDPGHSRSGHQVTPNDFTSEKVWMFVIATPIYRLPWNFQRLISVTVSVKRVSRNFDIGRCSSSGSWVMCLFCRKCWKLQNLTFGDLWWPYLWPELINGRSSFVQFIYKLTSIHNV